MSSPYKRCLCGMMRVRKGTICWGIFSIFMGFLLLLDYLADYLNGYPHSIGTFGSLTSLVAGVFTVYGALNRRPNFLLPQVMTGVYGILFTIIAVPINFVYMTSDERTPAEQTVAKGHVVSYLLAGLIEVYTTRVTYMCFKHFKYQAKCIV
uniref:Rhomboid domain-containing protein n=1 Tax=Steinernema glaseri TaxID=37863 RepID=A0A1I7Y0M4_9BILA